MAEPTDASLSASLRGLDRDGRWLFALRTIRMFGYGFLAVVLVLYLAATAAAFRLIARGTVPRGLSTVIAVLGTIYGLWALYGAGYEANKWGAVLLATGIPVYFITRSRGGSSRTAAEHPAAPPESAA